MTAFMKRPGGDVVTYEIVLRVRDDRNAFSPDEARAQLEAGLEIADRGMWGGAMFWGGREIVSVTEVPGEGGGDDRREEARSCSAGTGPENAGVAQEPAERDQAL